MAVNTLPIFSKAGFDPPVVEITSVSNDYTGGGSPTTIVTAGSDGAQINGIRFKAQGSTVANKILIFLDTGSAKEIIDDIIVPDSGDTTAVTVKSWEFDWYPPEPIRLVSGDIISACKFATGSADFSAIPMGGSLTA